MSYIFAILLYAFTSFALMRIGAKSGFSRPWLAWVPLAREYVAVSASGRRWWYFVFLFIPLVNIWASYMIWSRIARNAGESAWLGVLMLVPFVNLFVMSLFALRSNFSKDHTRDSRSL